MYFYTIEVFDEMIPTFLKSIDTSNLFKLSIVSEPYKFDMEAQSQLEMLLTDVLDDDLLEQMTLEYNPDFFPESVLMSQLTDEELEEGIQLVGELEDYLAAEEELIDDFHFSLEGLPEPANTEPEIYDFIQNSYVIIDEEFETLVLRASVIIEPPTVKYINFDTNTTVH